MSDFDDLFEQTRNGALGNLLRDSRVVLVDDTNSARPLKVGEYFFDNDTNTLYVGTYREKKVFGLWEFITHATSVKYIPAPRVRSDLEARLPIITHATIVNVRRTPKLSFAHEVALPIISHSVIVNKASDYELSFNLEVPLYEIEHNTIIRKVEN